MSKSAIVLMIISCVLVWGGLLGCIVIAVKNERKK